MNLSKQLSDWANLGSKDKIKGNVEKIYCLWLIFPNKKKTQKIQLENYFFFDKKKNIKRKKKGKF